ncbi:MAG: response regulator transcription factor [Campylobacterota bacterium]
MKTILPILKNLNILYAEDDKNIRQSTDKTLSLLFNHVYTACNGQEALEYFNNETIHIVLLDYVMPKLDGYKVAKAIRQKNKKIPIIISSGYSDKEKLLNAIELNLVKYIVKPLQYDQLSKTLQTSVNILKDNAMLSIPLSHGLSYDYVKKSLYSEDLAIPLTKYEIRFLELLIENKEKILDKELLKEAVYGSSIEQNTLRNMVYRLRKKVGVEFIQTVKDLGYKLA